MPAAAVRTFRIARVIKSLCNEKPHDRRGDPTDDVQSDRNRMSGKAGIENIRQMIQRHGGAGDEFQRIYAQFFMHSLQKQAGAG